MTCGAPIPILRIFDEAKAREYYVGFLGFKIDWENRFEPDAPLYAQISRGDAVLHLSEHHGDSSPGAGVRIPVGDLDGLHAELTTKKYKYNRPGIQTMPWGLRELTANDPFLNRIIFYEEKSAKTGE
jgi:catechol 2,3-dioxygenase-like lactoylglutathione lyase family enzyme